MATLIQMLEYTLAQKDPLLANETKRIVLKEALQAYVLDFLYNHPEYRRLNFYGGTCLHVVYGLNRLSEDLDLDNSQGVETGSLPGDLTGYFQQTLGYGDTVAKTQPGENGILGTTLKFPVLNVLGLSAHPNEALHLKVEISTHRQVAVIRKTPVFFYGRSFVPAHFSIETMMAGKMLACLERSFQRGRGGADIKGRDFYDLLWLMQRNVRPLEEKLAKDGKRPYTVAEAMQELLEKVRRIRPADLAVDLLPLFEQRSFIEAWLEGFHQNFEELAKGYI
ncbi:MAG TPA: nucleotidyl transferase AbiEii/AbiGii toxin family protein [Anaerolineaceae bacterium]|nr:nucleotidyl transferase AbiEii/AbiGii toxin family protein [Anaerolineaceae bacterium]